MVTEAQRKASQRYGRKMTQFLMKLRNDADSDVIARLKAVGNRTDYIRELVRKDIKKSGLAKQEVR